MVPRGQGRAFWVQARVRKSEDYSEMTRWAEVHGGGLR